LIWTYSRRIKVSTSLDANYSIWGGFMIYLWSGHFKKISKKPHNQGMPSRNANATDWRATICQAFFAMTPTLTDKMITEDMGSRLMCSLYGTKMMHPEVSDMAQNEFQFSRAAKLYDFLSTIVSPFFRSRIEKLT
jgi:hypothetical protein